MVEGRHQSARWAWTRVRSLRSCPSEKKPVVDKVDNARSTLRCNKLGTSEKHVVWDYLTAEPSTAGAVTQPVPAALILALRAYLTHFRPKPTPDLDPNQGFKHTFLLSKKSLDNKNGLNDFVSFIQLETWLIMIECFQVYRYYQ